MLTGISLKITLKFQHIEHLGHRAGQPVRVLHHDVTERGGRGAHEEDREGGGAARIRGSGQESFPPLHRQPRHRLLIFCVIKFDQ